MTKTKLSALSGAFVLALAGLNMSASEVDFSYTYGDKNYDEIGTGKANETYDIAIRIADPSLVGTKITSFSVPFVNSDGISNISVWATKELKLEKKVNIPDITSVEANCVDGFINVTFPEKIEIPEGGVYVGYTFTVDTKDEATGTPVSVAGKVNEDGLYMHTNRTYLKWKSYSATFGKSSAITVTLEGDFQANALSVESVASAHATPGEEIEVKTNVLNHGSEPISNLEYVVSFGENPGETQTFSFNAPQAVSFSEKFVLNLPAIAPVELGEYALKVEITKVNGEVNGDVLNSGVSSLAVLDQVPVHKPLMEEYTGLWCGWCPRGFVGLEAMNNRHPEEFVAISYHNRDAMERIPSSQYPSQVTGFPAAWFDRIYDVDAYYGDDYTSFFGIEPFWQSVQETFTPAIVNGSAIQNEDGTISVNSDVTFVQSLEGSYKVAYAIIANGLTDPSWKQSNNYAGDKAANYVPEMEKFCTGGSSVEGLIFDDVFAAGSNLKGEASSLIENPKGNETHPHDFSFAADAGMSTSNYDLFANAPDLFAVIILLDENGAVVNTNKIPVANHNSGIDSVLDNAKAVSAEYYDLNGSRVANPSKGIFIKVTTLDNGKKVTKKVVR